MGPLRKPVLTVAKRCVPLYRGGGWQKLMAGTELNVSKSEQT